MNPDKTIKSPEGLQTPTQVDLEASPGAVQAPLTAGASVQPRLRTLEISTLTTRDVPNTWYRWFPHVYNGQIIDIKHIIPFNILLSLSLYMLSF